MRIRIANILPKDKFNITGRLADVSENDIVIGYPLILVLEDNKVLQTSRIQDVQYEYGRAIITTNNSIYCLDPID